MVATAERVGKVARIGGWGGVWLIRAMPELKRFFCFALVPKVTSSKAKFKNDIESLMASHKSFQTRLFRHLMGENGGSEKLHK